jgi:hypothetical protein
MKHLPLLFSLTLLSSAFSLAQTSQAVRIDLTQKQKWQLLTYRKITPNEVDFSKQGMRIAVNKSASPLIYPLPQPTNANQLTFQLSIEGKLSLGQQAQGEKGADDFLFRLGLVHEGKQKLSGLKKMLAADWIKTLFSLAPDTGVNRIDFYTIHSDPALKNKNRTHPLSDLLHEYYVAPTQDSGKYNITVPIQNKSPILAIWLSSDGDDTASDYKVMVNKIELQP